MLEIVDSLPSVLGDELWLCVKSSDMYSIPFGSSKGLQKGGGVMMLEASAKGGMFVSDSRTVTIESVGNGLRSICWYKLFASPFATSC